MSTFRTAFILVSISLLGLDPITPAKWSALEAALIRMVEVMALPFHLARLAARPADTLLLMPVAGATVRQVADTWGAPRRGGRTHTGQDIFARRGTTVFSATAGYVLRVGRNSLGGNAVVIAGAGGRRYYYAHLEALGPETRLGKRVTPDTVIGFVGNTGNALHTPPHLHFTVYTRAGPINPLPLLRNRESPAP
jgi:murein DD-endopeptidase MepM/ murein hydrolase activator NlpD